MPERIKLGGTTPVAIGAVRPVKDNEDQVPKYRAATRVNVKSPRFVLMTALKKLRDEKRKKRRTVRLPSDLTKGGEFPNRNESIEHRMQECIAMMKYLNDINRETVERKARTIVRTRNASVAKERFFNELARERSKTRC
jgi:hypothetical protein